ncbi:maleylpyruvate isomerase family mycothiol-dependent enzyme [Nonomuraea sp. K274]|uniref:Maleylpyruvate isomerase family mycothiol-dependent enzyme n=1 Tax=Nonomuraea cypriaca TaxID=1187855 RepID=A0A931AH69_9ACTN|nr:maleylpyruvate isomerase family mycothiol-dependent enzyme [Nonomuraea cypriaca]MBF8192626.1 maleylpyruvate isomerase family mycothiol-dependent enzyme [Nonomuraea cypriaca]
MDFDRYLELLELDYARLRETAARDLAAAVPSCPGWTAADLLFHVGEVYQHKTEAMRRGAFPDPWPPEPDPAEPAAYLDLAMSELRAELTSRKPQDQTPTWYDPDQTVGFWARRMALETVVHRVDAELAAGEPIMPIPDDLAVDGIDEVLLTCLAYGVGKWPEDFGDTLAGADGRTVSIGAGDEHWLVRVTASEVEVTRDGSTGDASISGTPPDLLLWLWGRADDDAVTFSGTGEPLERLRALLKGATQ